YSGTFPNSVYNAAQTTPFPISSGGTGSATPAMTAGNGITITGSWPFNTITANVGAGNYNDPSNPAGSASLSAVMMGIGCLTTPNKTGKIFFHIQGNSANTVSSA